MAILSESTRAVLNRLRPSPNRRGPQVRMRRFIAALLIGWATALSVWVLIPPSGDTKVVVAAAEVPAGTVLAPQHVRVVLFPKALAPAHALHSVEEAVGKQLSAGATTGSPITEASLLEAGQLAHEGQVLMPVRLADAATAEMLKPGHRIRLFAASDAPSSDEAVSDDPAMPKKPRALVDSALVAHISARENGVLSGDSAAVITVVVSADEAAALAQATGLPLSFAMLP